MKTFYTTNISTESYISIRLLCNAINKTKAFYKFKEYINRKLKNTDIDFSIKLIKELSNKVKGFMCFD